MRLELGIVKIKDVQFGEESIIKEGTLYVNKEELKALVQIGIREDLDLLEVKGSFAGAFGLPQFIPTSYLTYGADGNGDDNIQLHDRYDAIVSVANYLKAHGWRPGSTNEEMMKVLFRYNRSRLYGETVLKCAGKLKDHQAS